jgi:hypothetical protein
MVIQWMAGFSGTNAVLGTFHIAAVELCFQSGKSYRGAELTTMANCLLPGAVPYENGSKESFKQNLVGATKNRETKSFGRILYVLVQYVHVCNTSCDWKKYRPSSISSQTYSDHTPPNGAILLLLALGLTFQVDPKCLRIS